MLFDGGASSEAREMKKCGSPERPLVPPVPSPFTGVLYSAERGLPRRRKLSVASERVHTGKTPGRSDEAQVARVNT